MREPLPRIGAEFPMQPFHIVFLKDFRILPGLHIGVVIQHRNDGGGQAFGIAQGKEDPPQPLGQTVIDLLDVIEPFVDIFE
jgi:hypothetical protein